MRTLLRLIVVLALGSLSPLHATSQEPSPLGQARSLAAAVADSALGGELLAEVATAYALHGDRDTALAIAAPLPPSLRAAVLIELATHLTDQRGADAAQLLLDAQTAKALTNDWRKARVARLLAVGYARLGKFEAAVALAHTVPDAEERAFAQQDVVAALNRSGDVARSRELAGTIEENRRYGTYRQKATALADTARTLFQRGNADDAATLLAQAELLLPKKPGWADGIAYRNVALAAFACGEPTKAAALLEKAEALARQIAGPWKVTEFTGVATSWRTCGDVTRATALLTEASAFLGSLAPLESADETPTLARAWHAAGETARARTLLNGVITAAGAAANAEAWRKAHVRALVVSDELLSRGAPSK